jgi:hypothetical protein
VGYVKVTGDNAVELAARIMLVKAGLANERKERAEAWRRDPVKRAEFERMMAENQKMSELLSRACGYGEPLTAPACPRCQSPAAR